MALFFVLILALAAVVFSQRKSRKRFWSALVAAAALVSAIIIYSFPHCVPADKLSRLQKGMTREEVVGLLGQPVSTNQFSEGRFKISYDKPFRYCTVDVFFDSTGHVEGVFHDH